MPCFETVELHPQDPAGVAALARAESHAAGCASCAKRLTQVRETDATKRWSQI